MLNGINANNKSVKHRRRIMAVTLKKATREDAETIWRMQVEAFSDLLKRYQDDHLSPAAESLSKVMEKFEQPWTRYFFIVENETVVIF